MLPKHCASVIAAAGLVRAVATVANTVRHEDRREQLGLEASVLAVKVAIGARRSSCRAQNASASLLQLSGGSQRVTPGLFCEGDSMYDYCYQMTYPRRRPAFGCATVLRMTCKSRCAMRSPLHPAVANTCALKGRVGKTLAGWLCPEMQWLHVAVCDQGVSHLVRHSHPRNRKRRR